MCTKPLSRRCTDDFGRSTSSAVWVSWSAKTVCVTNSSGRGCDRYTSVVGTLVETLALLDIKSARFHVPVSHVVIEARATAVGLR